MLVEEAYVRNNDRCIWSVNVCRNLNDREGEAYVNLLKNISDFQICSDPDQVLWRGCKNGEFSVSSYYNKLMSHTKCSSSRFPNTLIGKNSASLRMAFLLGRPIGKAF